MDIMDEQLNQRSEKYNFNYKTNVIQRKEAVGGET
jgi:hypothetical protein